MAKLIQTRFGEIEKIYNIKNFYNPLSNNSNLNEGFFLRYFNSNIKNKYFVIDEKTILFSEKRKIEKLNKTKNYY